MIYYISYTNQHGQLAFWSPRFGRARLARPDGTEVRSKEDLPGGRPLFKISPIRDGYRWLARGSCIGKLIGDRLLEVGMATSKKGTCAEWRERNKRKATPPHTASVYTTPQLRSCRKCSAPTANYFYCSPCHERMEIAGDRDYRDISKAVHEFDLRRIDPSYSKAREQAAQFDPRPYGSRSSEARKWHEDKLELERQLILQSRGY